MQITGLMVRRLLVNWRVPPEMARRVLPAGLRPKIVAGYAVAGLCLVGLRHVRPAGMPGWMGLASENLAVRIAVEWGGGSGVLIFRRETASRINAFIGSHAHLGTHHRAAFHVRDDGRATHITVCGLDDRHRHHASVMEAKSAAAGVFKDVAAAEEFFPGGECGYSPGRTRGTWEGLRLHMHRWAMQPTRVMAARSTFVDALFEGAAVLDSAFIMWHVEHTWTPLPAMQWGERPAGGQQMGRLHAA